MEKACEPSLQNEKHQHSTASIYSDGWRGVDRRGGVKHLINTFPPTFSIQSFNEAMHVHVQMFVCVFGSLS